jgi:hypothetical protein
MANNLSPEMMLQIFSQRSNDPFLTLLTLSHADFSSDIRLVNDVQDITSRDLEFIAFPFKLTLPKDDGEVSRDIQIEFDNVGLELIQPIRSVTTAIGVKLEMILASIPDEVQMSFEELTIQNISYSKRRISAKLFLDTFLNTEMTSEKYLPSIFPGLF